MTSNQIVETQYGRVQGAFDGNVRKWLGIPYAQAPRFGPPQPVNPWTDIRPALAYGPVAPSMMGTSLKAIEGPNISEDCLYLNVWAPLDTEKPKPVMVWIHGGAFMAGSGDMSDGSAFAADHDIVVVSINYRLGVLGFVNFGEALDIPDIPSNIGLRDQIEALKWVRDNIAAFGGDPNKVTIAGESAGALSISLLMLMPRVWPLFHGAILESGAVSVVQSRELSLELAAQYANILGIHSGELDKLRSIDRMSIFKAQAEVHKSCGFNLPASPWYDGDLLPEDFETARKLPTAPVPMIAGFNRDEIRLFQIMPGPEVLPMTRQHYETLIRDQLSPELANKIMDAYADNKRGNRRLGTHLTFGLPTFHFAERHSVSQPTWFYRFDCKHLLVGAAMHVMELTYLWPMKGFLGLLMRGAPYTGKRKQLGERMQRHWAHFVRKGAPEANWPQFETESRRTILFNMEDRIVSDPEAPCRAVWQGADVLTGK